MVQPLNTNGSTHPHPLLFLSFIPDPFRPWPQLQSPSISVRSGEQKVTGVPGRLHASIYLSVPCYSWAVSSDCVVLAFS